MTETKIKTRIQQKHDIEVNWLNASISDPPMKGEIIVYDREVDADGNTLTNIDGSLALPPDRTVPYTYERFKIGDGITLVDKLPFVVNPHTHTDKYSKVIDEESGEELVVISKTTSSTTNERKAYLDNEVLTMVKVTPNSQLQHASRVFPDYHQFYIWSGDEKTPDGNNLYYRCSVLPKMTFLNTTFSDYPGDINESGGVNSNDSLLKDFDTNPESWVDETATKGRYTKDVILHYPNQSGTLALEENVDNIKNNLSKEIALKPINPNATAISVKDRHSTITSGTQYSYAFGMGKIGGPNESKQNRFNTAFGRGTIGSATATSTCEYNLASGYGIVNDGVSYGTALNKGTVNHTYSLASGWGSQTTNTHQTVVGRFNTVEGAPSALFVVGMGADNDNRSNAFEVLTDGRAKVYTAPVAANDVVRLSDLPTIQIITWGEDD